MRSLLVLLLCATPLLAQSPRNETVSAEELQKLQQLLAKLNLVQAKPLDAWMKQLAQMGVPLPPALQPTPPPPEPEKRPQVATPHKVQEMAKQLEMSENQRIPPSAAPLPTPTPPASNVADALKNNPELAGLAKAWEKNVGPLDESPAVRDTLVEMSKNLKSGDLGDLNKLMDELKSSEGFTDLLKSIDSDLNVKKLLDPESEKKSGSFWDNFKAPNIPGGSLAAPSSGGTGVSVSGGTWLPVIAFVVIVVAALVLWKFWPRIMGHLPLPPDVAVRKLNRWPVDPRHVNSREELVKAFEYLSLLMCGDAARVWHHRTIASALRAKFPAAELIADELATLYEFARYTPPGEELPPSALVDARRCLCHISGVRA